MEKLGFRRSQQDKFESVSKKLIKKRKGRPPKAKLYDPNYDTSPLDPRTKIKLEATNLFYHKGFYGVSIGDIADAAQVTKPVIYYHYDSKKGLYLTIVQEALDEILSAYKKAIDENTKKSVPAILKAIAMAFYNWSINKTELAVLLAFFLSTQNKEFMSISNDYVKRRNALLKPIFEEGVNKKTIPYNDATFANLVFSQLLLSPILIAAGYFKTLNKASTAKELMKVFFQGKDV